MEKQESSEQQVQLSRNSFMASLLILKRQGVPINSVIDIGCADGTFSLECLNFINPNMGILNIDAQSTYESSLQKIQDKVGGYYKICAVSANDSIVQFSIGSHAYWAGIKSGDEQLECVDCRSIDSLLGELDLPAPYLIKMYIEGGDFNAVQGAVKTLEHTAALILETDIYYAPNSAGNFLDIYNFLAARNFSLFDVLYFGYRETDEALFQIYSVFLNKNFEFRHQQGMLKGEASEAALRDVMIARREKLLQLNEDLLNRWTHLQASLSNQKGES